MLPAQVHCFSKAPILWLKMRKQQIFLPLCSKHVYTSKETDSIYRRLLPLIGLCANMYLVYHFANAYEQNSPFHPKILKKISRIFGGQLISMNIPLRKEEGSYNYSFRVGGTLLHLLLKKGRVIMSTCRRSQILPTPRSSHKNASPSYAF